MSREKQVKSCVECGAPLVRKSLTGPPPKYCSGSCRARACNRRAHADGRFEEWAAATRQRKLKPPIKQACRYCGDVVVDTRRRVRCDSDECRRAANADRVRPHVRMRSAARRGAAISERFTHEDIFERDGWRCGICRRKVSRTLKHPHPMSASLDHIVPIADGGVHARKNVQCAHLECNVRRNRTGPGQLLLFG